MKFTSILFLTFVATVTATPTPDANPDATPDTLVKRVSCKRVLRFRPDQYGICVDDNLPDACRNGALYSGLCPGGNNIRCCIN